MSGFKSNATVVTVFNALEVVEESLVSFGEESIPTIIIEGKNLGRVTIQAVDHQDGSSHVLVNGKPICINGKLMY